MDLLNIGNKIIDKVEQSELIRKSLRERAEEKAKASADYDVAIAKAILQLSTGALKEVEFDGKFYYTEDLIASNYEKIAKGICWQEKLKADTAEELLKCAAKSLDAVQAEMSGLQSVYKYMTEVPRK